MKSNWIYFVFIVIPIIFGCGKGYDDGNTKKKVEMIKIKEIRFGLGYSGGALINEKDQFTVEELAENSPSYGAQGGKNEIHYLIYLNEPASNKVEFLKIWSRENENGRSTIFSIKKHYAYTGETLLHGYIKYWGDKFPPGDYTLEIPMQDPLTNSKKVFSANFTVTN